MRAVIQRVNQAAVTVCENCVGSIEKGLFILLGVAKGDERLDAELLCSKIIKLRIFSDEFGKMNLSCRDASGQMLVVSNFTLNANYSHGNRPDYFSSAAPDEARELYEYFIQRIKDAGIVCQSGQFGADMRCDVSLDGPVTIVMDSDILKKGKRTDF